MGSPALIGIPQDLRETAQFRWVGAVWTVKDSSGKFLSLRVHDRVTFTLLLWSFGGRRNQSEGSFIKWVLLEGIEVGLQLRRAFGEVFIEGRPHLLFRGLLNQHLFD